MPIDYRRERDVNSISDDVVLDLGNGSDAALVLRSTALAADAELSNVIVGTSDHPGVAANSLIIANQTADGDIMLAVQTGGNTTQSLLIDASAATFYFDGSIVHKGGAVEFNAGTEDYDFTIDANDLANIFNIDGGVNGNKGSVTMGYSANPDPNNRAWFKVYPPAITTATDKSTAWVGIQPDGVMTMAGTVPVAATLALEEPNLSGNPTASATLYIKDAPTEPTTASYALWVDDGLCRVDKGMVIGHTAQITVDSHIPEFQILGTGQVDSGAVLFRGGDGSGGSGNKYGPALYLAKGRDAIGTYTTDLEVGDILGAIRWSGSDGGQANLDGSFAEISAEVDAAAAGNDDMPGRLIFSTTPDTLRVPVERMRIDNGGDVKVVTGNLIIGTDGKGIDFTANTTDEGGAGSVGSELLDDYEEGTFTPIIVPATGSITSHDIQVGNYTKVGSWVHCEGYVRSDNIGDGEGNYKLGGFPFNFPNLSNHFSAGTVGFGGSLALAAAGQNVTLYGDLNASTATLQVWNSTAGTSSITHTTWSAGGAIMFAIDYQLV